MSTTSTEAGGPQHSLSEDEQLLHKLGYAQELMRGWGGFSNFPISFTIISILAGCLSSYYLAIGWGGPLGASWGRLVAGGLFIPVLVGVGEIGPPLPTASGPCYLDPPPGRA